MSKFRLIAYLLFLFAPCHAQEGNISFSQLNTSNGLSENNVKSVAIDKKGFLWIGTIDGLNIYDGYTVTVYKKEDHPEMPTNIIVHLTCDSKNRIWMGASDGISWVDEKRNVHKVILNDSVSKFACRTIVDTKVYGPVLFTSLGQFFFSAEKRKWERLDWITDDYKYERFSDAEPFDDNKIIYGTDSAVLILDYASKKTLFRYRGYAFSLCKYSDHEVAVGFEHGLVQVIDINTNKVNQSYRITSVLNQKKINSTITELRSAVNGSLLVCTGYNGLTIIDKQGKMWNYSHNPVNSASLASNLTWRALCSKNGDVVIGTVTGGVSMFNIFSKQAGYLRLITDGHGDYFDGYIARMQEDKNGTVWIGALERLIRWDRKINQFKFFYYYSKPIASGAQNVEIRSLCIDKRNQVWVATLGDGIAILDEAGNKFKKIPVDSTLSPATKSPVLVGMYCAPDGKIWVGSLNGMYTIDPRTYNVNTYMDHDQLKQLSGIRVNAFLDDTAAHKMWFATYKGVFVYDYKENRIENFTAKEGLAHDQCFTLTQVLNGDMYVTTLRGLSIFSNGKIKTYNKTNGLKYDYVEGVLQDDEGKVWICNTKIIIRFDPEKQSMQYFDENAGLTREGFRMQSYLKTSDGYLLWGSRRGLNYFKPEELINQAADFRLSIYQADIRDSSFYLSGQDSINLRYTDNRIAFHFAAINLLGLRNVQYQYKLDGYDKQWQNGRDIREARYSSLPPGKYTFYVKATVDGKKWVEAQNGISLRVIPPIWQQWWFITLVAGFAVAGAIVYVRMREYKIRSQREELEAEQAINYFASSMHNQYSVDTILWDVARNCIGRLQFEDCVVYLMDDKRKLLMQKAAYGPKSPKQFEINDPIEIPLGRGIVGSVAESGKAEIISDTSKDERYIVDDERRYSEISVPILSGEKVLGVIDCEHSKKAFFTQKHLSILTTIASLCANKIIRARAEEERKEAERTLMMTKQKMSEIEMQALRAQMNPHFIFNCLNSINRYIVKSDQATASLYLTRFAKLIRLILDNSNTKNVILSNELEALRLYIDMESLRFDQKFTYTIQVDEDINPESIELPPLIIQPYVENAIWHGLLHKEEGGNLDIHISMEAQNMLRCEIHDNGVGREKAKEMKSKSATTRKSLGMKLTENRLTLMNEHAHLNASVEIIDLKSDENKPLGTKVILMIPV